MTRSVSTETNRRSLIRLLVVAFSGFALVATIVVLASAGDRREGGGGDGPYRGSEPPIRITLPEFDLQRYDGGRVSTDDVRGRVVLVTLLDAQCTDVCPVLASVIARTIDRLGAEERPEVWAIAVSGDPVEDTPGSVRRFLAAQRVHGRLDYLLGREGELRPLWTALQVLPSLDTGLDTVHSAPLRIYDRAGVWVATLHAGADLNEDNLLHDIRAVLAADDETSR